MFLCREQGPLQHFAHIKRMHVWAARFPHEQFRTMIFFSRASMTRFPSLLSNHFLPMSSKLFSISKFCKYLSSAISRGFTCSLLPNEDINICTTPLRYMYHSILKCDVYCSSTCSTKVSMISKNYYVFFSVLYKW